jgi:hypothetical protein
LREKAAEEPAALSEESSVPRTTYPYDIPVLVLSYFPDENHDGYLDPKETGISGWTIDGMRENVRGLNNQIMDGLERGSTYHGYKDGSANPSLDYHIFEEREFIKPVPKEAGTGSRPADHIKILIGEGFDICDHVENHGVKEVWLWMYHTDKVYPVESYQQGPYGGVGNGYMNLPSCSKTVLSSRLCNETFPPVLPFPHHLQIWSVAIESRYSFPFVPLIQLTDLKVQ